MALVMRQESDPLSAFDFDNLFSLPMETFTDEEFQAFANFHDEIIWDADSDFPAKSESQQSSTPPEKTLSCDPVCGVCGASATGYNFDQITCESCKAFFRRNALRSTPDLKCRFGGSCVINVNTRRQCTSCRLNKCFAIGMRKEWIRTEEETKLRQLQKLLKQERKLKGSNCDSAALIPLPIVVRKKKRLLLKPMNMNAGQPTFSGVYFGFHRNLSDDDQAWLNNITHAYQNGAERADSTFIKKYTDSATLSQFINDECAMHCSLIQYYKGVREFKMLDLDDQVLLIKSNLVNIIHLHHIIVENFEDTPEIGKHMTKWISGSFHEQMARTRQCFYRFAKYPLLLKLAMVVLVFSVNSSGTHTVSPSGAFKNARQLLTCQNYYTDLLWRYMNHLFDEKEAIFAMELIVRQILRYQTLMIVMEDQVREMTKHVKVHELMQSIFGLS